MWTYSTVAWVETPLSWINRDVPGGEASEMSVSVVSGLHWRGPSNSMLNGDGRWLRG
jgi:hypothetical protein